jgi:hypothetical protein
MVTFVEKTEQNNEFALFLKLDPKARLRFEILFKKFHPRINLTTLFFPKIYLLNTIKPFLSHANRSMTKSQKPLQREYPWEPEYQSSEYIVLFLDPKLLNKSPSDLFSDEIRLRNFSFPHSETKFVWEIPLGLKVLEFQVSSCLLKAKVLKKSAISSVL